jgi:hypothetical protein
LCGSGHVYRRRKNENIRSFHDPCLGGGIDALATAGIAPNTGASAMSQSGAKIAPAKKTQDESTENQDTKKGRNQ